MRKINFVFLQFLIVWLFSLFSLAADFMAENPYAADNRNSRADGEGMDVEDIDLRKGVMTFEIPMFSIPVSGKLQLDLSLSFNKSSTISDDFIATEYEPIFVGGGTGAGGWQVEAPRIIAGRYADYVCGRSTGFILVLPGEVSRQFVVNNNSSLFPGANFVSMDNWIARCKTMVAVDPYQVRRSGDGFWGDYTANGDFEILSPDGRIFIFERKVPITIDGYSKTPNLQTLRVSAYEGVAMQQPAFYVDRVQDQFGNYIKYNFGEVGLTSIVTSRGQAVYLGYGKFSSTVKSGPKSYSVTKSIDYVSGVTLNNRTWTLGYSFCPGGYGVGCFDLDKVSYTEAGSFGTLRRYILRNLKDPEGREYSFTYTNYTRPGKRDYYHSAQGRHYHLTGLKTPEQLVNSYSFSPTCSYFFDGMPTSFDVGPSSNFYSTLKASLCTKTLAINQIKRTGIQVARDIRYYYHVPNMVDHETYSNQVINSLWPATGSKTVPPAPGDPVSYTFEWDMTAKRLSTYKYRRDPQAGDLLNPMNPSLFDTNMLLEASVFPAPTVDIALPSPLPIPPPVPPSVWVDVDSVTFNVKDSMQVQFHTSGQTVVTARCIIDGHIEVFCAPGSPVQLPELKRGSHTLSIVVGDAYQGYSTEQVVQLIVEGPLSAEELFMLILNPVLMED